MRFTAQTLSEAIEAVALFDPANPRTGRFQLVILDHRQEVQVERSGDPSNPEVTLRLPGAGQAKEKARALMSGWLENRSDIIFSDHGPRGRVYHGQLPLRVRLANWIELVVYFSTLVFVMVICGYLYGQSPLRAELGILGWVLSVLLGLLIGLHVTRWLHWLIGPQQADWSQDDSEEGVVPDEQGR